jgi:hypothetical protein
MQGNLRVVQYIFAFTEIGLLESVFRTIVNRSRVYPPLADLPAVFVEGLPAVILAGWPADYLMT